MEQPKLFMAVVGCKPPGRHTEQHDVFFGIGASISELVPDMLDFWPEANGKIHLDAWREVTHVDGHSVRVLPATPVTGQSGRNFLPPPAPSPVKVKLFFLNLGGYKENEMEEYHYKCLCAVEDKGAAVTQAKQTAFYKHTGFAGATSHIDDKYGVDVDDLYEIEDILPKAMKEKYSILLEATAGSSETDPLHIGYFKLEHRSFIRQ